MKKILLTFLGLTVGISFGEDLVSSYIKGEVPLDPFNAAWKNAKSITVNLAGQGVVAPMELNPSVTTLTVKSINNGKDIAFLLIWTDKTKDDIHAVNKFSDAVAIEIPYKPTTDTPITMGSKEYPVLLLKWSASKQRNIEKGYADLPVIEPNSLVEWYPGAKEPYNYPADWDTKYATDYIGGEKVYLRNNLQTSVMEFDAYGYSTATWKNTQEAKGYGTYKDGKWYVVIKRPFKESTSANPEWKPGSNTLVTFAVWDGSHGERGGRKALNYSWINLKIEGK